MAWKAKPRPADANLRLSLHHKQEIALNSAATDILYGGAAGGGKSHLARIAAIIWASQIPGLQVFIFRKIFDDLLKNHMEGPTGFRSLLEPWTSTGLVKIVETEIRFLFNGAKIYLCHCQHDQDRWKYLGYEMHVLILEEASQLSETVQRFLASRVRMPAVIKEKVPPAWRERFPRILRTSNPGGVGHDYLRREFVSPRKPLKIERVAKSEGGWLRQFLPAQLQDNPSLDKDDYSAKLSQIGSPELVRAMLFGDWDAVLGSFFGDIWHEWRDSGGIIKPFSLPKSWTRARSFDWGSARPFSVGWWAIANGEQPTDCEIAIPRGAVVRYAEWYGAKRPNEGLGLTPREIADGILTKERTRGDTDIAYSVADPAIFRAEWGASVAEEMQSVGVVFRPGDNRRVAGWQQMMQRMRGEDGKLMFYVFDTCRTFLRIGPVAPRDEANWEDIDTNCEDHVLDEARYFCMSRPWSKEPAPILPIRDIKQMTVKELFSEQDRRMDRRRRRRA